MFIIFNISEKINELKSYTKEEMWYIVKQEMEFWKVCYAVKILEEYKSIKTSSENLESFFKRRANEIKTKKGFEKFISTHRMLLQGYMLGLIIKKDNQYKNAYVSSVFKLIDSRCNGEFEKIDLYYDILENQVEKVYFSSFLDEECNGKRKRYRLYPLFLLYKVLIEIGKITGKYEISKKEYVVFICSTSSYSEYLSTVFYILDSRTNIQFKKEIDDIYEKLKDDIRYHKLLTCIESIEQTSDGSFKIKDDYIDYVNKKIYLFETSKKIKCNSKQYEKLLSSDESLLNDDSLKENDMERYDSVDLSSIEENKVNECISRNLIIYGAPGTGKSNKLEKEYREKYFKNDFLYSRVTFNPNYSYTDFVGVYKPTPIYIDKENDSAKYYKSNKVDELDKKMLPVIDYTFVPGEFIEILCRALNDETHNYLLLIEEINRADVTSVFGDVFQLLDRDDEGKSQYGIAFNKDVMDYIASKVTKKTDCFIKDEKVRIPSNMYIWATMNSADQNVIKMDTAFKRRWDFDYIGLDTYENGAENIYIKFNFLDKKIKWNDFRHVLNDYLIEVVEVSEDKLIGPYFITDLRKDIEDGIEIKYITDAALKYKLLLYLKDDVVRLNPTEVFKENYTFGKLIEKYDECIDGKYTSIFTDKLTKLLAEQSK